MPVVNLLLSGKHTPLPIMKTTLFTYRNLITLALALTTLWAMFRNQLFTVENALLFLLLLGILFVLNRNHRAEEFLRDNGLPIRFVALALAGALVFVTSPERSMRLFMYAMAIYGTASIIFDLIDRYFIKE